jgi:hypothetical protein
MNHVRGSLGLDGPAGPGLGQAGEQAADPVDAAEGGLDEVGAGVGNTLVLGLADADKLQAVIKS